MTVAERTRIVGVSLIVPVVLIVLWWVLSADSTSAFYPSLSSILTSFKDTWLFSRVGSDVVPSLIRFGLPAIRWPCPGDLLRRAVRAAAGCCDLAFQPTVQFARVDPSDGPGAGHHHADRHRQRPEDLPDRVRLHVPDPAQHDRRRARRRAAGSRRRAVVPAHAPTADAARSCCPRRRRRSSPACGISLAVALILMVDHRDGGVPPTASASSRSMPSRASRSRACGPGSILLGLLGAPAQRRVPARRAARARAGTTGATRRGPD